MTLLPGDPPTASVEPDGASVPITQEDLRRALDGDGVDALYQPIVDTARGVVVGYEALARFPGFAEKNPETWFRAARRYGEGAALEAVALRRALGNRASLPMNSFLTVNVSPDLLLTDAVQGVWRDEGDLSGLVIELTEQTPIDSYVHLEPALNTLKSAGALIAVDDAGAGYAGLHHLLAIRPSMIKLDRGLVEGVDQDESKRALIEMLGTFAGRIDAWILAEGVERVEELDALAGLNVPLVQGYLLGRPAPAWAGLDLDVAHRLAARHRTVHPARVRDLLEQIPVTWSLADAANSFSLDLNLHTVVLVDEWSRPVSIIDPDGAGLGVSTPGLRINIDTPIREALGRAITRPRQDRLQPLLVIDNAGRYVGIARLERMIATLL